MSVQFGGAIRDVNLKATCACLSTTTLATVKLLRMKSGHGSFIVSSSPFHVWSTSMPMIGGGG
jgi:hypothetical protein